MGKYVNISYFLEERKDRIKPDIANNSGLKRIEKINFSGKIFISDSKKTKTNMILVKTNDLVISGINVEKGALSVYQGEEDVLATIHYSSYIYDDKKINIEYLRYFLKSPRFKEIIIEQTGNGIKTEIKAKKFLKLNVFLPDLPEQLEVLKKIHYIENNIIEQEDISNKNCDFVKLLKQSILQEAIEGKLTKSWREKNRDIESASVLLEQIKAEKEELVKQKKLKKQKELNPIKKDEFFFDIPEKWKWVKLGELGEFFNGNSINESEKKLKYTNLSEGYNYIGTKDVSFDYYINYENGIKIPYNNNFKIAKKDTLLICAEGGSAGKKIAITNQDICFGNKLYAINFYYLLPIKYLFYIYRSSYFFDTFTKSKNGIIGGISLTNFKNIIIPLPPLQEQKEIVKKVDDLMILCNELEKQTLETKKNSENLIKAVLGEVFNK